MNKSLNFYKMIIHIAIVLSHRKKENPLSFLLNCTCKQQEKKGKMQYLNNNNHQVVTIRPVSPFSRWPPTTFLPHQRLSQKSAAKPAGSRQSNPRCSWPLRLTRRSRRQSELRSRRTQKTSTWSPASASWTGWRSGRSNHFEQSLEKAQEKQNDIKKDKPFQRSKHLHTQMHLFKHSFKHALKWKVSSKFHLHSKMFKLKIIISKKLTRVHRIRCHPFPFSDSGQFLAKVNVGQLAAAVGEERQQIIVEVLEVQLLVFVVGAREGDHPAGGTLFQAWQEQIGEEEVAQVVDSETHAESVVRPIQDTGHAWGDGKTRAVKRVWSLRSQLDFIFTKAMKSKRNRGRSILANFFKPAFVESPECIWANVSRYLRCWSGCRVSSLSGGSSCRTLEQTSS